MGRIMKIYGDKIGFLDELKRPYGSIVIVSHVGLDGDHLGSVIALSEALREVLDCPVYGYVPEGIPQSFRYLRGLDSLSLTPEWDPSESLLIVVECPSPRMLPQDLELKSFKRSVAIDHHGDNALFTDYSWVNSGKVAVGSMVFEALEDLDITWTKTIAEALFLAIATDSGYFQFDRVTGDTHRIAGKLIDLGARSSLVAEHYYRSYKVCELMLLGTVLQRAKTELDGRVLWSYVRLNDLKTVSEGSWSTRSYLDELDRVADVDVTILFVEKKSGLTKVGFRSRGFEVDKFAAKMGGGGHPKAAGAHLELPLDDAVSTVLKPLEEAILSFR